MMHNNINYDNFSNFLHYNRTYVHCNRINTVFRFNKPDMIGMEELKSVSEASWKYWNYVLNRGFLMV